VLQLFFRQGLTFLCGADLGAWSSHLCLPQSYFYFLFYSDYFIGIWTQALTLTRQALTAWATLTAPLPLAANHWATLLREAESCLFSTWSACCRRNSHL
jgi:hypothetical protein